MSGDLKNPSKSIPKGTLHGLLFTFVAYTLVIFAMGATISRETLYTNTNVIQGVSFIEPTVLPSSSHPVDRKLRIVLDQRLTANHPDGRIRDIFFLRADGCNRLCQISAGTG